MSTEILTIGLGFIEGFALIISPCILPILPIFLAGSLTGTKKRPLGIIVGFSAFFAIFAYFSRKFVLYSGIDLNYIRYVAYGILVFLGLIMFSTYLTNKFSQWTQGFANLGSNYLNQLNSDSGFIGGVFLGGLLALIWTPCAGPILATIIVQTVIQKTTLISFITLLAFAFGAGIPMFIIAFYGRQLMNNFRFFKTHATLVRKILGAIIISSVAYMIYQEQGFVSTATAQSTIKTSTSLQNGLWRTYPAPEIDGIDTWINSPPLVLSSLKGKVVLIDFWTYSCINCVRTLPYLKDWYIKYHDKGLVIIGVHTPEFDFEKNVENVKNAVIRNGINYPVALDNQFVTWQNFSNHYWPAHYLIDKNGQVVYEHFGEGDYDVTDNNIRFLLGIDQVASPPTQSEEIFSATLTPETYLGYARADKNYSPILIADKDIEYQFSNKLVINSWGLQGGWQVFADKIVSTKANAALKIHFNASKVYIVMGSANNKPIKVKLFLNGEQLIDEKGKDVSDSSIVVNRHALYEVIDLKHLNDGLLQIITSEPGLELYTFTFGS